MIVLVASDTPKYMKKEHDRYSYLENLKVLLHSMKRLGIHTTEKAVIHLMNCNKEEDKDIKNIYPNSEILHSYNTQDGAEILLYKTVRLQIPTISNILEKNLDDHVFFIDTDMIVNRDFRHLLDNNKNDSFIKIWHRREKKAETHKLQKSFFLLPNTKTVRKAVLFWKEYADSCMEWYGDQLGLYVAIKKYNIDIINIGNSYTDMHFNSNSYLWHCKKRYNVEPWKSVYNSYLKEIYEK